MTPNLRTGSTLDFYRQVVAFAVGDHSEKTWQRFWNAIPRAHRTAICNSDFWVAYAAAIPRAQHPQVGKEAGESAHVERYNNTLRQLLIYRYNEECRVVLDM